MPSRAETPPCETLEEKQSLPCRMRDGFHVVAKKMSDVVGSAWSFSAALVIILVWAVTGPLFHFSDTWQLIINTGTTIVTFLMVFLIQNTQNRDAQAIHLKLDELIRALKGARIEMVDLENLSDDELKRLQEQFERMGKRADGHTEEKAVSAMKKKVEEKLVERQKR